MTQTSNAPTIRLRDVHGFYGESHVLHGVNFDVCEGEVVTIAGRNGAGKTTTLRAIMGNLTRTRGEISFGAHDLRAAKRKNIPRLGIGYVPEDRGIFASLTVKENLLLPRVVASGGMSMDRIHDLFPNLKGRDGTQGTRLSGGEQQMLAIARILRTGARTILLDEPTEGLAPVIIEQIGLVLRALREDGFTILLVEQNFRFAQSISDRFLVMEEGQIVDAFEADEIRRNPAQLEAYLGV